MNQPETISIKDYLTQKGIEFKESNGELVTKCLFNDCDKNSRQNEAHLYFNPATSQYHCKKCNAKGNIFTLAEHLGDDKKDVIVKKLANNNKQSKTPRFSKALVEKCHKELPDRIRKYLNSRGITDELISEFKLGFGGKFYGKFWITIPIKDIDGNFMFFKLRKDPDDSKNEIKYIVYPKGKEATLYGWEELENKNNNMIVVCEGELDRLILYKNGIPAVTSTGGAGTFKDEWAQYFNHLDKIYLCFDKDETGEQGLQRAGEILSKIEDLKIYQISLPDSLGEKADITDYFLKTDGNVDDLIKKYTKKILNPAKIGRVIKAQKPKKEINFEEWEKIIATNFPELLFPAEIGLSIMAQILIQDITNPFALVLVDVPSAGKTICINFFAEIEGLTYATDKFSPASFVSNAANVKKEKLTEIDLLPKLKYKMFLLRDLATLFSKRDEDLKDVMGTLTRVLDGEGLNTDSGIHGHRQYVGEYLFMMLAGSTPIPPKVWNIMGNLGSRLFFLNLHSQEKTEDELADQLQFTAYKEKENKCRKTTQSFLYTLWSKYPQGIEWNKSGEDKDCLKTIARCAKLLARLRGVVNAWRDKSEDGEKYSYTDPVVEQPHRINQLFYNLCRGHALVCDRHQINKDDLRLIVELAIDSAPTIRTKLFRALLENNGVISSSQVEVILNVSKPTALREMEILKILGLVNITQNSYGQVGGAEKEIHLLDKFQWFLSEECRTIRGIPLPLKQSTMADLLN